MTRRSARTASETRQFYDSAAGAIAERWADRSVMAPFLDHFASLLHPSALVADLGCGPGHDSQQLKDRGLNVIGLDFSMRLLATAHNRHPGIDLALQDMLCLAVQMESVDGAWASASLLHIPRRLQLNALAEVRRVLKPGGVLYASVQAGNGHALVESLEYGTRMRRLYVYYRPDEWEKLLRRSGFDVLRLQIDYGSEASLDPGAVGWISAFARRL